MIGQTSHNINTNHKKYYKNAKVQLFFPSAVAYGLRAYKRHRTVGFACIIGGGAQLDARLHVNRKVFFKALKSEMCALRLSCNGT